MYMNINNETFILESFIKVLGLIIDERLKWVA